MIAFSVESCINIGKGTCCQKWHKYLHGQKRIISRFCIWTLFFIKLLSSIVFTTVLWSQHHPVHNKHSPTGKPHLSGFPTRGLSRGLCVGKGPASYDDHVQFYRTTGRWRRQRSRAVAGKQGQKANSAICIDYANPPFPSLPG